MASEAARVAQRCEEAKEEGEALDLSGCDLRKFPDAVYFLMKGLELQSVSLAHNDLKLLQKKFSSKFPTLTRLDISFNQISSLPDEIAELQNLASLNLSHNSLSLLPDSLSSMDSLIELDISYNQISHHFELSSLEVLKAANNLLASLPISPSSNCIREIDVSSNQIVSLGMREEDLIMIASLQVVDLRNNPLLEELRYFFSSITSIKVFIDA